MKNIKAENLLKSLIEIESMSGEETKVLSFLESLLKKEGFKLKRIPVKKDTFCLFATVGNPKIVLQAHVDTVQPFISYRENDTTIFGRGACDTKASVATMMVAGIKAKQDGLQNFGLLFTPEEETTFQGAIEATKFFKNTQLYFIVGEPSSLKPITSHFGIETFTITAKGKSSHTSMPESGINAIDKLFVAYKKMKKLKLGTGTISTIAQVSGGIAANIIPAKAQLILSMRIAPGDKTNYLQKIQTLIKPCVVKRGEFLKPVKSSLPKQLQFLGEGQTVRYCTELAFFRTGCIIGPGDIRFAHSENEQVKKSELARAVELYRKIIIIFAKSNILIERFLA